jgi:hypothetical protein
MIAVRPPKTIETIILMVSRLFMLDINWPLDPEQVSWLRILM